MRRTARRLAGLAPTFAAAVLALAAALPASAAEGPETPSPEAVEFFEKQIRPLLVERCVGCHGSKEQWGALRLDTPPAALKGGESGPAVVPGKPEESELIRRVSNADESLRMPPEDEGPRLSAAQIDALRQWIAGGAVWPGSREHAREETSAENHWAFQQVHRTVPPDVADEARCRAPVDRFLMQKLEAEGLAYAPAADRRTLIRRAAYDLTGLPPTPDEVRAFVKDESPDAYERLIDRLLASPHYGEQWGRHWLDVARYSDTKGYVYAREERFFAHASVYRDWVIEALNADLSYDRFVLLQLAADQAAPDDPRALAAMGFLTLGRRFLGVTPDIIDDRIDVVTRGLMGLTVACARCHDHKYDPIPTADYYSLYGIFQNCAERTTAIPPAHGAPSPSAEFTAELEKREHALRETLAARREEASKRIRERIADYLFAQRELDKYPIQGFDVVLSKEDLIPATVRLWERYLAAAAKANDPVFLPWLAFAELREEEWSAGAAAIVRRFNASEDAPAVNSRIALAFIDPPASPREVADRYGKVFAAIDREWQALRSAAERDGLPSPQSLPDADDEALRQVLYGPRSPCVIPDEPIVNLESFFDLGTVTELWKLQGEVDRWLLAAPRAAPHAVILTDRAHPVEPRIFRRGNPATPGDHVPRRFVELLSGQDRPAFAQGSGRLELANCIIAPENPLTTRVWVNRVWSHHFGAGLVTTPSDFGTRAAPPSHPELLDWLAAEFISHGWNTKWLHRQILLSAAYRQRSDGPPDLAAKRQAQQLDPENRLLWRMTPRRLSFEELRDTLLAASGELDAAIGGKPVEYFPGEPHGLRRSVYGLVDRQFVPNVLRAFDFANPDLHTPARSQTTVPQQALFALNHPFVAARARALAARVAAEASTPEQHAARLYESVLQRAPNPAQQDAAIHFIDAARSELVANSVPPGASAWSYGYGALDEALGLLKEFHPLPHFTGSAWQGGPRWPDATLGWVQLTAAGGHAGNDLAHAAVRRWTAPADMAIDVQSVAVHEVAAGDGVRCRIVSSRHGLLKSAVLHHTKLQIDLEHIMLKAGDSLDFIVDLNANLNSDQFLWAPRIRSTAGDAPAGSERIVLKEWNAETDFTGSRETPLAPWEQLAQVLLVSNELLFVD